MNELSGIFDGDLTIKIFCFSSIAFLLFYLAGVVLLQRWRPASGLMPVVQRHIVSGLGAGLAAAGIGFGLYSANVAAASPGGQSAIAISPHELHRLVGTKSLPVQKFEDQMLVFPNRD